jgi:hypothetical protein
LDKIIISGVIEGSGLPQVEPTIAMCPSPPIAGLAAAAAPAVAASKGYPPKPRSSGGSSSDTDAPKEIRTSEQSEDFMMNVYKLKMCPRR